MEFDVILVRQWPFFRVLAKLQNEMKGALFSFFSEKNLSFYEPLLFIDTDAVVERFF